MKYSYVKEGGWLSNVSHSINQQKMGKVRFIPQCYENTQQFLHSHKFPSTFFQIQYLLIVVGNGRESYILLGRTEAISPTSSKSKS